MEFSKPGLVDLFRDKYIASLSITVIFFSLTSSVFISLFMGTVLLSTFFGSIFFTYVFFRDGRHVPNLLGLFTGVTGSAGGQKELPRSCSVCGGERCNRQHPNSLDKASHVHVDFTVPQSIDKALDDLLNDVMDCHIYSWYREISVHDQLADEIRFIIRYAAASVGSRLMKVDLSQVITNKLVPAMVSHLDAYMEGGRRLRGNTSLETAVVQYLQGGNALHEALASREAESAYLKGIVTSLLPYLLPSKYLNSDVAKSFLEDLLGHFLLLQGLDLLATPDTVNLLFLLLFEDNEQSTWKPQEEEDPELHFLRNFASVNTHPRNSVLRSNLSSVLKDQSLLYLFHTFLKEEGAINVLQFCLAVEDFNHHILDPDLTQQQLEQLHREALELYHTYMVPTAVDRLIFPSDIVLQIREIVHSEVNDIVKLRTTRPLFQAYEHAYNLLEREYLPLFMNSNAYFGHVCGSKTTQAYHQRNSSRDFDGTGRARASVGKTVVKKVGSGIKNIFKPNAIIGDDARAYYDGIDQADDISSYLMAEDGSVAQSQGLGGLTSSFRDLSAWRVTIPRVEQRVDHSGKHSMNFVVDVTRIDVTGVNAEDLHWEVERRYHEFYILEAKLTEFHGEFPDNQLPPRKSIFASKDGDFMHTRRQNFEEFLQKLLQKPSLRGSQLLFLFLKTKDEFATTFLPDVSIGRFIRDVPRKLMKERGQHLDSFISVFLESTSSCLKSKLSHDMEEGTIPDVEENNTTEPDIQRVLSTIFNDNAQSLPLPQQDQPPQPQTTIGINGIVETLLFVGVRVYGLSLNVVRWATCLRVLAGNTLDAGVSWFISSKLSQALQPPKLVKLIKLIQDALFVDPPEDRTEADCRMRECQLRQQVIDLIPSWIQRLLFTEDAYTEGANTLVNLFQHPLLNKQLSYVLLDMVLNELFPELRIDEDESPFLKQLQ